MDFERNLVELLAIIIIIIFLQKKTNINEKDLLTLILINIFIFVLYDYLSTNKMCPSIESFNNNEPCNIKDIEHLFNKFISNKKEKFSQPKNIPVTAEDELADLISQKINNISTETAEEGEDVEDIITDEGSAVVKDIVPDIDVETATLEIDEVVAEYEAEKEKAVKTSMCAKSDWSDLANTYGDASASYPNIFTESTNLVYPNYDNIELPCVKIDKRVELPKNHTNNINDVRKETDSEKELKNKLWSCQRKLSKCN